MIEVNGLSKRYGAERAVDNISFQVQTGEVLGFLGPNGAGKTTTMKVITCYLPPSEGSVKVDGLDVQADSLDVRHKIGYLPENTPLDAHMRAREYLNFRGRIRGLDRSGRATAIKRVTDVCWLGDFIDRPIHQLSKGMRQRVGLADALLHDPKGLHGKVKQLTPQEIDDLTAYVQSL